MNNTDTTNHTALDHLNALLDIDNQSDDCPVAIDLVDIMCGATADDAFGAESVHFLWMVQLVGQLDTNDPDVMAFYRDLGVCPEHHTDLDICSESDLDCVND
jgi:hypothetical protein